MMTSDLLSVAKYILELMSSNLGTRSPSEQREKASSCSVRDVTRLSDIANTPTHRSLPYIAPRDLHSKSLWASYLDSLWKFLAETLVLEADA